MLRKVCLNSLSIAWLDKVYLECTGLQNLKLLCI